MMPSNENKSKEIIVMAKFADHMEKIAESVTEGYQKIEDGVVEGFGKVVDKCVEALFVRNGESVEDAKKRLNHKEEK